MARRSTLFGNRSVIELMVLLFTGVVVLVIVITTLGVVITELRDPTVDTAVGVDFLVRTTTTLLAALFGLLAGQNQALDRRPDGTDDEIILPRETK
jgi:cytochrome c biogenesis factor